MSKKALVTLALLLTLISTGSPLLAQGRRGQVLFQHEVNSPRDPSSGIIAPRDAASGLATSIVSPHDLSSGQASG
ncbi:MAG: hypothetical protein GC204_05940 [Chloroflexi bacterium]|nr:hypothetical protein [Chloroflexota bacterium]